MKTLALSLLLGSSPALAEESKDWVCREKLDAVVGELSGLIFHGDEKTLPPFNKRYYAVLQDVWSLCKTEQAGVPIQCTMNSDIYVYEPDCVPVDPAALPAPSKRPVNYVPFYSVVVQDAIPDGKCSVFSSSIDKFTVVDTPVEPVQGLTAYEASLRGRISRTTSEACLGAVSGRKVTCTETRMENATALDCKAGKSF